VFGHSPMAVQQGLASRWVCAQQSAGQPLADARPGVAVGSEKVSRLAQSEVGEGKLFVPIGRRSVDQVVHEAGETVAASFPFRWAEWRWAGREHRSGLFARTGQMAVGIHQGSPWS
jgi:hypothetical protein